MPAFPGVSTLRSPGGCTGSAGVAALLPYKTPWHRRAKPRSPLTAPLPPAQGSRPQPQESFPSQTPREGRPFGAGCRAGRARRPGGGPIKARRAGDQQGRLPAGGAHGAALTPGPPGLGLGWGLRGGCARLSPAPAPASPSAPASPVPELSFCPRAPLKARLAPGRSRPRRGTGRRNATSSPESDQTIRAKASHQILPPPWETTQQHSRYLPG